MRPIPGVLRWARRTNSAVRLDLYIAAAVLVAIAFLFGASCLLERPSFPDGLDASLVPLRPPVLRLINAGGRFFRTFFAGGFNPYPLDVDDMLLQATIATGGLSDFGNNSNFYAGLDAMVTSLNEDSNLSMMGQIVARSLIVRSLHVRMAFWYNQPW